MRRRWHWIIGIVCLTGLVPQIVCAKSKVGQLLQSIYDDQSVMHNVTVPQVVHGQQAGYYTGGSLVARTPSKQLSPVHVELPHYSAGCGGIDIYTGGLSFVNGGEYGEMLKNIASGSTGFAVELALASISPKTENIVAKVKYAADMINRHNINSCEMSSLLVGAAWPKHDVASQHVCAQTANLNGKLADYVSAKHSCGSQAQRTKHLNAASRETQVLARHNVNIVWEALKQQGIVSADKGRAEWLLSMAGTTIYTTANQAPKRLPALLAHQTAGTIGQLLDGTGDIAVYRCDDASDLANRCLRPSKHIEAVGEGLTKRVLTHIETIKTKIVTRAALDDNEMQFLSHVSLPVYKMIDLDTMTRDGQSYYGVSQYAEVIALDWLVVELEQLLQSVLQAMRSSDFSSSEIKPITESINSTLNALHKVARRAHAEQQAVGQWIGKMRPLEQLRTSQFVAQLATSLYDGQAAADSGVNIENASKTQREGTL